MQDRADAATDKIESRLLQRLMSVYDGALEQALENNKAFFQKIKDLETGKIKPPASVANDPEKLAKWKQGFYRELMRRENVVKDIANRLAEAGGEASEEIRETMREVYTTNNEYVRDMVADANDGVTFAAADKRQLEVIMQENESPFSKIAYKNLGSNTKVREMLQRELGIATLNGESQREIIARIRKVAGMTSKQAKRVVQTERTRVQSQARWQAGEAAKALGVEIVNEWSTRMVNSRDTHIALNGQKVPQGERFPNSVLRFPGDPEAPASEVINCRCVLVPDVVAPSGSKNKLKDESTAPQPKTEIVPEVTETVSQAPQASKAVATSGHIEEVMTSEMLDTYNSTISNAPANVRAVHDKYKDRIVFADTNSKKHPHFTYSEGGVTIDLEAAFAKRNGQTVYHETGHAIDNGIHIAKTFTGKGKWGGSLQYGYSYTYKKNAFGKAIKQDADAALESYRLDLERKYKAAEDAARKAFAAEETKTRTLLGMLGMSGEEIEEEISFSLSESIRKAQVAAGFVSPPPSTRKEIEESFSEFIKSTLPLEARTDLSDMFESTFSYVKYPFGAGHGLEYWQQGDFLQPTEAFAEMYSSQISVPESWEQINKYFPNAVAVFNEMLEEATR